MSICDKCIHDDVCGLEDNHEEGRVSCADMIPKDIFNKIKAEIMQVANQEKFYDEKWALGLRHAVNIIDKYRAESEEV